VHLNIQRTQARQRLDQVHHLQALGRLQAGSGRGDLSGAGVGRVSEQAPVGEGTSQGQRRKGAALRCVRLGVRASCWGREEVRLHRLGVG